MPYIIISKNYVLAKKRLESTLFVMIISLLSLNEAHAESFNLRKLMMPGELGASHADLEDNCNQCHIGFQKTAQNKLCLNCHEDIQSDLVANKGFHGTLAADAFDTNASTKIDCKQCHTDHRGRSTSLTITHAANVDHQRTAFPLEGAHQQADCAACHAAGKKKREADTQCIACHKSDDQHNGALGDQCGDCHSDIKGQTADNWSITHFDHDTTDFKLQHQHAEIACNTCHVNQRYQDTPRSCHACHALDDIHQGKRGKQCTNCHNENSWNEIVFDHNSQTDFELRGEHKNLNCVVCHKSDSLEIVDGNNCIDCHSADDIHLGQRGKACKDCHTEKRWSDSQFNHSSNTEFALHGKHANLACESCHKKKLGSSEISSQCIECHRSDDVHQNAQGNDCARCHNDRGWTKAVIFDHDLTTFPLIGLHALITCEQCHIKKPFESTANDCISCHQHDDDHKASLGQQCDQCHTPNGWNFWLFDHNVQTKFDLDGSHEGLACDACHNSPTKGNVELNAQCVNCHKDDDTHEGEFGHFCDRCHSTENFNSLLNK